MSQVLCVYVCMYAYLYVFQHKNYPFTAPLRNPVQMLHCILQLRNFNHHSQWRTENEDSSLLGCYATTCKYSPMTLFLTAWPLKIHQSTYHNTPKDLTLQHYSGNWTTCYREHFNPLRPGWAICWPKGLFEQRIIRPSISLPFKHVKLLSHPQDFHSDHITE